MTPATPLEPKKLSRSTEASPDCPHESNKASDGIHNNICSQSTTHRAASAMPGQHGLDHAGLALKRISLNLTLPLQRPQNPGHGQHVVRH